MQQEWAGATVMTLNIHVDRHQTAFILLLEATNHVSHQVLNERTRVVHLLQSITSKDANVLVAIAAIEMYDAGMREDFEDAVAFLAPTCPVAKKQSNKRVGFYSATIAATSGGLGIGKTGVELQYHKIPAFLALSQEQRDKLIAHTSTVYGGKYKGAIKTTGQKRKSNSGGGGGLSDKKLKALVSSAVAKSREEEETSGDQKTKLAESLLAMISSMTGKTAGQATIGAAYATEENDTMDKAMAAAGNLLGLC